MFEIILEDNYLQVLNAQEIMDLIPNRYPILYMDYVDEMEPGKSIIATKNVTINEQFFQGHFPGNPVMPGVLIIESLAQAASILILSSPDFKGKTAYLGGVNDAKFKRMVKPGDVLKLHIEFVKQRANMGIVSAKAMVDGKVATSAELMFIVAPNTTTA
ncbi:3-hydroxyacyl-ACP dehydratase FabZ [Periweissella fabalis]|uniref:3-hydroxyacyl-[acyl-carrier-protein] dehydratase FabZ n=1 Tax=Periweissella fabalis TaxID=1070421 RepID=A0A7X6S3F9_9LACO|nr:3-hydroxyacyl-ACP dehydratase FabZ [Periweissella fabalis]MCM0598547.1 3-hydroxyacyl-ACP dehydratase FabZ [Periweissella fabalis]NKZ24171.1 3-hydroxyacyl-ACP dehydratase FabZ [Periweissella fabalis]